MARDDRRVVRREIAFDDVEVGSAYAARADLGTDLPRLQRRNLTLLDGEPIRRNRARPVKYRGRRR